MEERNTMSCHRPEAAAPAASATSQHDFNAYDRMEPRSPAPVPREARMGARVQPA
jgi:hypothetical protein